MTRDPQEVFVSMGNKGIKLVDVPGVGESSERDMEYGKLYAKLLPELDLVLWVLKADDRAFSSDENFYKKLVKPHMEQGKPFLIALNQVDKVEPFREWSTEVNRPGPVQSKNIQDKRVAVARYFDLPLNQILPIAANEKYGLMELVDSMVHVLPPEKRITVIKNIDPTVVSDDAWEEANAGFWAAVLGGLVGAVKGFMSGGWVSGLIGFVKGIFGF
jgi:predicted GTPase